MPEHMYSSVLHLGLNVYAGRQIQNVMSRSGSGSGPITVRHTLTRHVSCGMCPYDGAVTGRVYVL